MNTNVLFKKMSNEEYAALNTRIKYLRKNILKISQEQFGKELGLTQGYISSIEANERNLSFEAYEKIQNAFNINQKWLETGVGEIFHKPNKAVENEALSRISNAYNLCENELLFVKNFLSLPSKKRQQVISAIKLISDTPELSDD